MNFSLKLVLFSILFFVGASQAMQTANNQQQEQKQQKTKFLPVIKGCIKIAAGSALSLLPGMAYYKYINENGLKNFFYLPIRTFKRGSFKNKRTLSTAYIMTGLGAYLLQSGIRDLYRLKNNISSPKSQNIENKI